MAHPPTGCRPQDFSGPITPDEQAAVDNECRQFESVIRAAGNRSLGTQWGTDDGRFAEMLLCDQLSRGAFRGTPDAMAFDPRGIELRRELYADGVHQAAYDVAQWPFFLTPGEHSEDIADHKANEDILRFVAGKHGAEHPIVAMLQHACDEHFEIIKRFGRYIQWRLAMHHAVPRTRCCRPRSCLNLFLPMQWACAHTFAVNDTHHRPNCP